MSSIMKNDVKQLNLKNSIDDQTVINYNTKTEDSDYESLESEKVKCSAVSTMERGMPTHDISDVSEKLREQFLENARVNPEKYRDQDLERIRKDLWQTKRYLIRNKLDFDAALNMMKASLEFRGAPDIYAFAYPAEFYKIGGMFPYERDRKNNVVVYMRVCYNLTIPSINQVIKSFIFHQIDQADIEAKGKGIALMFDLRNVGFANVDMKLLHFIITSLLKYFPKGLSYILVHQLPWYLRSCWTVARQWLPEEYRELIKFSNDQTIHEYIDRRNLPDFLGGTCNRDYRKVPDDALSMKEAIELWNFSEDEAVRILKRYEPFLPKENDTQHKEVLSAA